MQRVLVLEKDRETAERLVSALKRVGIESISLVPTMREACLILTQQPQDIAFVPLDEGQQLLQSLRALQADLPMILTTPDPQAIFPDDYPQKFQGLLHTNLLEIELPAFLSGSRPEQIALSEQEKDGLPVIGLGRLRKAYEQAGLDAASAVQLVVLSYGNRLMGFYGQMGEAQARVVTRAVAATWQKEALTAQVQFLELPDFYDAQLLYTRPAAGILLTLAAGPDSSLGDLRKTADRLAIYLATSNKRSGEKDNGRNGFTEKMNGTGMETESASSFAVAWQPVRPLPAVIQNALQKMISGLAVDNVCRLRHLSILPDVVHLVIVCPPGRTAAWAAFFLKEGTNSEIQRQFGIQSTIWTKGFYATQSDQPLTEAELRMMLAPE
jgi:hypothetical protein